MGSHASAARTQCLSRDGCGVSNRCSCLVGHLSPRPFCRDVLQTLARRPLARPFRTRTLSDMSGGLAADRRHSLGSLNWETAHGTGFLPEARLPVLRGKPEP